MTRLTDRAVPELDVDIMLDLILGPTRCTEQELRLAWHAYRGEFGSGDCGPPRCACRMWAYWKFEIGEERPEGEDEALRLAELGLITDDEVAKIAEDARRARERLASGENFYDNTEQALQGDVELHERVIATLEERG